MAMHNELGNIGENLAANYLEKHGYLLVDRNVKMHRGELDLIAREGGDFVFIEVKTRSSKKFGDPAEAITPEKSRRIARAAKEYLHTNHQKDESIRCDVVCIILADDNTSSIELYKNAINLGDYIED